MPYLTLIRFKTVTIRKSIEIVVAYWYLTDNSLSLNIQCNGSIHRRTPKMAYFKYFWLCFFVSFLFFPSSPSNSTCRTNFMSFLDLTQNWELHFKYAHLTFIWKKNSSSICCCCCCWVKPKFSHLFRFKCFPSGHSISIRKQMREVIPTTCLFPEASDAQMYGSIGFVANFCVCQKMNVEEKSALYERRLV